MTRALAAAQSPAAEALASATPSPLQASPAILAVLWGSTAPSCTTLPRWRLRLFSPAGLRLRLGGVPERAERWQLTRRTGMRLPREVHEGGDTAWGLAAVWPRRGLRRGRRQHGTMPVPGALPRPDRPASPEAAPERPLPTGAGTGLPATVPGRGTFRRGADRRTPTALPRWVEGKRPLGRVEPRTRRAAVATTDGGGRRRGGDRPSGHDLAALPGAGRLGVGRGALQGAAGAELGWGGLVTRVWPQRRTFTASGARQCHAAARAMAAGTAGQPVPAGTRRRPSGTQGQQPPMALPAGLPAWALPGPGRRSQLRTGTRG